MGRFELQKLKAKKLDTRDAKLVKNLKYMRSPSTVLNRTRYRVFDNKRSLPSASLNGTAWKRHEISNQKGVQDLSCDAYTHMFNG